jgi:hypothetical protein
VIDAIGTIDDVGAGFEFLERRSRNHCFEGSDASAVETGLQSPLTDMPLRWKGNNAARKMRAATAETAEAGQLIP